MLALEPEHIVAILLGVLAEDFGLVVWLADRGRRKVEHDRAGLEKRKGLELKVVEAGMNVIDKVIVDIMVPIEDIARGLNARGKGLAGSLPCVTKLVEDL